MGSPRLTIEQLNKRIEAKHGDGLTIVAYESMSKKAVFKCKEHGTFESKAMNVLNIGSGCPHCWADRRGPMQRKTHDQYVMEVAAKYGDTITVLGTYVRAKDNVLHQCSKGHKWEPRPNDILNGYGCPRCDTGSYRRKSITVDGVDFTTQGVEHHALKLLAKKFGVEQIQKPPAFPYYFRGKQRRYLPDFMVGDRIIVEVKSPSTLGIYEPHILTMVKFKRRAVVKAGFKFYMMVHNGGNGFRYILPKNWHKLSSKQLRRIIKRQEL